MTTVSGSSNSNSKTTRNISVQSIIAVLVLIFALVMSIVMAQTEAVLASLWLLAGAAGFTLQRSRFCFASAFRDVFLFGSSKIMKGIIVGLGVATIGFAIIMHHQVPFPSFGVTPNEANILPVGISTVVGGLIFGFGMVISGGCVSGSLYRMAEGYVASWVSIAGVLVGMGLMSHSWNWWWDNFISHESLIWLPGTFGLGYTGSVFLTLSGLLALFLFLTWREYRLGIFIPDINKNSSSPESFVENLKSLWKIIFVNGWSAVVGGSVLGGLVVLMYMTHMPWGVTGELSRWANVTMSTLNFGPAAMAGLSAIGGCAGRAGESGVFSHTFAVTVGLLPGALVGALFSKEFKLRFPKSGKRYVQALFGGVLMGYGAGLAIGCTIGAFFSSIPSGSVSGWLFAISLAGGAFLGVQVIKRIA